MAKLTTVRNGVQYFFDHATVKKAAQQACADVESNEAAPVCIEQDGLVVWKNTGPFDGSYDKLLEIAGLID